MLAYLKAEPGLLEAVKVQNIEGLSSVFASLEMLPSLPPPRSGRKLVRHMSASMLLLILQACDHKLNRKALEMIRSAWVQLEAHACEEEA